MTASKVARAEAVSPLFEAGKVLFPDQTPPWLPEFLEELASFPSGRHDDMVDASVLALDRLRSAPNPYAVPIGVPTKGGSKWFGKFEGGTSDAERAIFEALPSQQAKRAREAAERGGIAGPPLIISPSKWR